MDTPPFLLICCLMGMTKAMQEFVADESTLVDMVLEDLPIRECDSIIVSRSPIQNVGKTTVFYDNINDLIGFMEDKEALVNTVTRMECFILGSNATLKSLLSLFESRGLHCYPLRVTVLRISELWERLNCPSDWFVGVAKEGVRPKNQEEELD